MEETVMAASSTTVQTAAASSSSDWQNALLAWWHEWHYYLVTNAELYLDKAARVNLRATTSTTTQSLNWSEELSQWYAFGSWPDMTEYHECMKRAYVGLQDIGYWMWLTVRPILYSLVYLLWRTAQSVLGRLLPTIQYAMIEVCRFQLHLSWRQALGELILLVACVSLYKLARYLQKQKYIQRTRRYLQQKKKRVTKAIQSAYQEVFEVSILLAMTIPHAAFVGLCMTIKVFFSRWVTFVATETQATSILKWWYPLATTILLLHHARAFAAENSAEEEKDSKKSTSNKKSTKDKSSSSDNKKKNRRRRSSFGVPFHRTAPATSDSQNSNKDNAAGGEGPAPFIYTEEEMKEDAIYWLNFFVLRAIFSAIHTLATRIIVVRWLFDYPIVPSTIAQLELFFYIWIFVMPACFAILYPSAGDETSKDWSPIKRWCYQAALDPIFHIPMLFKDLVVPFFEQVSQAIPPSFWKRNVVDKVESILNGFVFVRMLSETRKDALVECLVNFQSLVLPALTFFTPGFITQYGVWYVEYIVPLAHSFKGLHKPHRHSQRVLYLQFWILHGIISAALRVTFGVLWWVPFTTHATFIVWCIMTMSRVISFLYNELDRELQTFGFLPKNPKHADDLVVEKAHTVRAFSYILSKLPSAVDKPENEAPDHDQKDNDIGDEDNAGGYDNVYDDDGDGTKEDKGTNNEDAKAAGEKSATKAAEKKKDDDAEEKENKASTNKDSKEEKTKKAAASSLPSTPTKDAGEKTEDLSPGQQLLRRSARHRRKSSS